MEPIAGYARTGRIQLGPGSDLVEVQDREGARLTAIQFHAEHRGHNAINSALTVVLGFLESPMVSGLGEMVAHDREQGAFVYPTGQAWSAAEIIRTLSDLGECAGVRAGVELLHAGGQILIEAAETGEGAGVYSHGGLTPWRVMFSADGSVQIIGHALPQVEILTFHEDPNRIPREDAFRYCPPERMESRKENFSSDIFGLALVAFELMTGKPIYDGLVNDIRSKAARGETSRRIHQFREQLPDGVREILTTALRPDIRDRYASGLDFMEAVDAALRNGNVVGAGLRDVMQRASRLQPRTKQDLDPARTSMLSKEELRKLAEEEDEPISRPARANVAVPSTRAPPVREPPAREPPAREPSAEPARPPPRETFASPVAAAPPSALSGSTLGQSSARIGIPQRRAPPRLAGNDGENLDGATPVGTPAPDAMTSRMMDTPAVVPRSPPPPPPPPPPVLESPPPPVSTLPPPNDGSRPPIGVARTPPGRRPAGATFIPNDNSAPFEPQRTVGPPPVIPPPPGAPTPLPQAASAPPRPPAEPPPSTITAPQVMRSSADELLARVRSSDQREPAQRSSPAASELLAKMLTSSGSSRKLDPPPPPPPEPKPAPTPGAAEHTDPPQARPAPRSVAPPPPAPSPAPAPPTASPAAAPRAPAAPTQHSPTQSAPTPAAPPTSAAAPAPPPPAPKPPPPAMSAAKPGAIAPRVPDPIKTNARGEPVAVRFGRGVGLHGARRRLPGGTTLAEAVSLMVGEVVPLRVATDGRVVGWYRIGPDSGPLPVDTLLETLDDEANYIFHPIENQLVTYDIDAPGIRLRLPLGTAIPVVSLIDALATTLSLPSGDWTLSLDGITLEPFHILADHPDGRLLTLKKS